jgi:catechol 2,3-dioxygenase-like lactoylglutathione lyase family enzyme
MSETTNPQVGTEGPTREFRVRMMFHPSHRVPDLGEVERWFEQVFGRLSPPLAATMRTPPRGYPTDYSTFTPIRDVLFYTVDPSRYVHDGVQRYPTVTEPHLDGLGWYVEGITEAYFELRRQGIRMTDQFEELVEEDDLPDNAGGTREMFFTLRADTGLRHQFIPMRQMPVDPRTADHWVLPAVSEEDPLGIVCCSYHTVLTCQPERALKFVVDMLGGNVVHEGRNQLLGASSTYVHLADTTLEFAVPDRGTAAYAQWSTREPDDTYHAITWMVADLEQVARQLESRGVRIQTRADEFLITDPSTSIGIPWGFSPTLIPGDPRLTP